MMFIKKYSNKQKISENMPNKAGGVALTLKQKGDKNIDKGIKY